MDSIVFLAFAAGTMTHFEHDLYEAQLPASEWQARWWQYSGRFQGVEPPAPRPPDLCDACTKSHLNDDPAQYYDYALATLIKFQLHDHICQKILNQDVRACDYAGSVPVGDFLRGLLALGATRDWREVMSKPPASRSAPAPCWSSSPPWKRSWTAATRARTASAEHASGVAWLCHAEPIAGGAGPSQGPALN